MFAVYTYHNVFHLVSAYDERNMFGLIGVLLLWKIAGSLWEIFIYCCQRQKLGVFLLFVYCTQMTVASQPTVQTYDDHLEHCFEFNCSSGTIGYSLPQQVQYEKLRLDFLKKCRTFKRPPQSLRVSGANGLDDSVKPTLISKLESEILENAIAQKNLEISKLSNTIKENPGNFLHVKKNLPKHKRRALEKHFQKKLDFFTGQNDSKWKSWPQKISPSTEKSKSTNFNKKARKRRNFVQKLADKAIKNNVVIPLVDIEVPAGAIVLLSKGLGFVKTPSLDKQGVQLDMRAATNKIKTAADKIHQVPNSLNHTASSTIPAKLKTNNYHKVDPSSDPVVNSLTDEMENDFTGILRSKAAHVAKKKSNISKAEQDGYKWLKKHVDDEKIVVCQADKGGAILLVDAKLIEEKVQEKLFDKNLYTELQNDPSLLLYDELFNTWKYGSEKGFVTPDEAYEVAGVTKRNQTTGCVGGNKSTSSRFRPGVPYFYPMLKIHKLKPDQLKPGCKPPARLVTALNVGVCKRSDVFVAQNFLKNVEKLYCEDLLKDTTGALNWLENLNDRYSSSQKKSFKCFTFDFASLYDSLSPSLVLRAVRHALEKVHPDWSHDKTEWLISLVDLSLRSSVGCFKGKWYSQNTGIATGGSICVELANIAVYYVLNEVIYSQSDLMTDIVSMKRFVDDCVGAFYGTERKFRKWENTVREKLLEYGLATEDLF